MLKVKKKYLLLNNINEFSTVQPRMESKTTYNISTSLKNTKSKVTNGKNK